MNSLFFFYTIAMLTLCIVTAVFSFAALASTRRRLFFFSTGAFVCYAIELTEIFFHEYISQNQPFPMDEYYAISMPVLRTAVSIILNAVRLASSSSTCSTSTPSVCSHGRSSCSQ